MTSITRNLPWFIRDLGVSIVGQECYTSLIENLDLSDVKCIKYSISKGLGIGIVVGGSIVKVPQLLSILNAKSARGLSLPAYILETFSYSITLVYAYRNAFPFSAYGENLFLTIQNILITVLITLYHTRSTTNASVAFCGVLALLFTLNFISLPLLAYTQLATLPLSLFSKLPQIRENYTAQSTGQLSAFAVVAQILGCAARLFTTATEVNDPVVAAGFQLALVLNLVLGVQLWMYAPSGAAAAKKEKEKKEEKAAAVPLVAPVPVAASSAVEPSSPVPAWQQRTATPPIGGGRKWARKTACLIFSALAILFRSGANTVKQSENGSKSSPVPNHHDPFSRWFVLCLDRIEGVEVPEYGVETSVEDKTVTCWIPSELGKTFSVHWENIGYDEDTVGDIDLDGTHCPGMIIRARSGRVPNAAEVAGGTDGSMLSAFMFSSLDLTDDDSFLGSSVNEDLGNIELSIYPVIEESFDEPQQLCNPNLDKVTLHERSKKAVTQQITLAEPEPERYTVASSTITCSGPDIVTFCFKYRPLDLLQANGIAPTTQVPKKEASSPAEEEVEVEEDTVDEEEIRALRDRLSILEAKRAVKKEKRVDVKSEFDLLSDLDPRPKKKLKIKREVIDLTL